jgi:hypothetical protein
MVKTATPHDAPTGSRRPSVPGIGPSLALVRLDARHDRQRFPRGQACVASGRLVNGAQDSAGQRSGPSGTNIGPASRTGACADAAVLCLREHPRSQKGLARSATTPGQGQALTVLAHQWARAVYDMGTRETAFARHPCLQASWRGVGVPVASREPRGLSLGRALCQA